MELGNLACKGRQRGSITCEKHVQTLRVVEAASVA